jgi:hypothetical protein
VRAALWSLLVLVALAQIGRLGAFMADERNTFGSAFPVPQLTEHMCMSAYVHAAALARRGEANVYDARHWPAFGEADTTSPVAGLAAHVWDPYEYPPPFLLLPDAALRVTDHFAAIRAGWFAVQCLLFVAVAFALACLVGGREGGVIALLVPALVASLPWMVNLQFGQAHLFTFALAMGALVCFRRGWTPAGGVLLGAATIFKLFPALIVIYLLVRRRWREAAWTVGAGVAITALALVVLGSAPFEAFLHYQLPRISSGAAFSFFHGDAAVVSRNLAIPGLVYKLAALGVPGMGDAAASALGWVFTLAVLALVVRVGRQGELAPLDEALVWLGLLCLGSLRSPLAPGIYVSVGALWLLVLVAARVRRKRDVALIVLAMLIVPGPPPLPDPVVDIAVAFVGQAIMVAVAVACVWRRAQVEHD